MIQKILVHYIYRHSSIKFWANSISLRETFLLSLLEMHIEPESTTGASVVLFW